MEGQSSFHPHTCWWSPMLHSSDGGLECRAQQQEACGPLQRGNSIYVHQCARDVSRDLDVHWDKKNIHVRLKMDNTSAVAYVNHMGGTRSSLLSSKVKELWTWCLDRGIVLSAENLLGEQNVAVDLQSRSLTGSAEWKLSSKVFKKVAQRLGPVNVDLFATCLNTQLSRYMSWRPDPFVMATDALQASWQGIQGYAFCLISRFLRKLVEEQTTVLLIAPRWPHQAWYPALLEALVEVPIILPPSPDLLLDPFNRPHPLLATLALNLAAWRVSGIDALWQEFQRRLRSSSLWGGVKVQTVHTSPHGPGGSAGVLLGTYVDPFSSPMIDFLNFLAD